MQIVGVNAVGSNYQYRWPGGDVEIFTHWIEYDAAATDGPHLNRVGFSTRQTYGQDRARVVVWIDGHPQAEFLGADDFDVSGEVLSEIRIPGDVGERICRYPSEPIPERYAGFQVVGLPTRVQGPGVHGAWAIIADLSDHRTMAALAALRRLERSR